MSRENRPHKVVLFVQAEVHCIDQHGHCTGDPCHKMPETIFTIDGQDQYIAIRKLNELVDRLKKGDG